MIRRNQRFSHLPDDAANTAWETLKWLCTQVDIRRRADFHAHFGISGRPSYRDTVPDTKIHMHSVHMPVQLTGPRVYLLFTGVETIEEFQHAIAWLAMQDRNKVTVLY